MVSAEFLSWTKPTRSRVNLIIKIWTAFRSSDISKKTLYTVSWLWELWIVTNVTIILIVVAKTIFLPDWSIAKSVEAIAELFKTTN